MSKIDKCTTTQLSGHWDIDLVLLSNTTRSSSTVLLHRTELAHASVSTDPLQPAPGGRRRVACT